MGKKIAQKHSPRTAQHNPVQLSTVVIDRYVSPTPLVLALLGLNEISPEAWILANDRARTVA